MNLFILLETNWKLVQKLKIFEEKLLILEAKDNEALLFGKPLRRVSSVLDRDGI
jgi:hypothetical protein